MAKKIEAQKAEETQQAQAPQPAKVAPSVPLAVMRPKIAAALAACHPPRHLEHLKHAQPDVYALWCQIRGHLLDMADACGMKPPEG